MPRPRQLSLLSPPTRDHGGDTRQGRRKIRRPFDAKRSLHVVLRSERARGTWSFLHRRNRAHLDLILYTRAEAAGVKLYRHVNVGNHLHLLVKAPSREAFQKFLRTLSGLIPRLITGARKGLPIRGRFWDAPAYSRVVGWGREFNAVLAYLAKNQLEAVGFRGFRVRLLAGHLSVIEPAPS